MHSNDRSGGTVSSFLLQATRASSRRMSAGIGTLVVEKRQRAREVTINDDELIVTLANGRQGAKFKLLGMVKETIGRLSMKT
jgi:hypothetical protein